MRKTLFVAFISASIASSALAQGIDGFTASQTFGLIGYSPDGGLSKVLAPLGSPSEIPVEPGVNSQLNIAFMAAPLGTSLQLTFDNLPNFTPAWTQAGQVLHNISSAPGVIPTTSITMPASAGAPLANIQLEIVAWTGTDATWAAAAADINSPVMLAYTGSFYDGGALGWSQPTGDNLVPAGVIHGDGGYNGLTLEFGPFPAPPPVPEPSTIALGGLGVAALFAMRRRK